MAAPLPRQARAGESSRKLDPAEHAAKGRLGDVLAAAQGESVKITLDAGEKPVECEVVIDGKSQGVYKGKNADHLQRIIALRLEEAGLQGSAQVIEKPPTSTDETTSDEPSSAPAQDSPSAPSMNDAGTSSETPEHASSSNS